MRKLFLSLLAVLVFAGHSSAADDIRMGVLGFLGTTEAKFQAGLDAFRENIPKGYRESVYNSGFARSLRAERRKIYFFGSLMRMIMSLRSGNVDEIMLPEDVGRYLVGINSDLEVKYMSEVFTSRIAFAFRKEDTALKADFDRAIESMDKDGTIEALSAKFIHSAGFRNPAPVRPQKFPGAETITVAVTGDMPPIDMFAGDGHPAGFNTAMLAEIGRLLGKNVKLINVEAGARNTALFSGRADVVFWYRTVEISIDDAKHKSEPIFIDAPDNVILSVPYYSWDREMILKAAEASGFWGLFKGK